MDFCVDTLYFEICFYYLQLANLYPSIGKEMNLAEYGTRAHTHNSYIALYACIAI